MKGAVILLTIILAVVFYQEDGFVGLLKLACGVGLGGIIEKMDRLK
jgi:hypothetical protein